MHLSTFFPAALALYQATVVNGWGFRLERNTPDEVAMLEREWYNNKATKGVKKCSAAGSIDGHSVDGFTITNFGPLDEGFREAPEHPKEWRDLLGWMGFWKNKKCDGLPVIIVHFYPVPYTRQTIYFPKLLNVASDLDINDLSVGFYGDIPFGSVWFRGDRQIPQGAAAVCMSPSRGAASAVYEAEFHVFHDAVRVINIGPNNDRSKVDDTDHRWDGSGNLPFLSPDRVVLEIGEDINISANEKTDRGVQVSLGLVASRQGLGPYVTPPQRYQNLLTGADDEDEDEFLEEGRAEIDAFPRGRAMEEERPQAKPDANTAAREELALQQAAYRSLQDQFQAPNGPGSTQASALQNAASMELESLPQDTAPSMSDTEQARSRATAQDLLSTLLERYPNWAQLSQDERRLRYNELQTEIKNRQSGQTITELASNTPNWNELTPVERYRLYKQAGRGVSGQQPQIELERQRETEAERKLREEEIRRQEEEATKRREEEREVRRQTQERRQREEETDNSKAIEDFINFLNRVRANYLRNNPPPPQENPEGDSGSNNPVPQQNAGSGGNVNQNNPRPQNPSGNAGPSRYNPQSQPNIGGSTGQNNSRPPNINPNGNTGPSNPQSQPSFGGNVGQKSYNPRPPNTSGNLNPNDPSFLSGFSGNMGQNNFNWALPNVGGNIGQNGPRPQNIGGTNVNPNNQRPQNPSGGANPNNQQSQRMFGGNPGSRRWEYGSLGPGPRGPGVDYFTSPNVNTGMNSPPFYRDYAGMGFNRPYDLPIRRNDQGGQAANNDQNQDAHGIGAHGTSRIPRPFSQAVDRIINNDFSWAYPDIDPSSNANVNRNNMEEETVVKEEEVLEENLIGVGNGNNGNDWQNDVIWGIPAENLQSDEEEETPAYRFRPNQRR
ncbi:hypothetical protein TWF481_002161 [Arthrobotrys musiformis]|uniref:Uncharacterized protein n=1 Tax=Arthrobotrys musiformis TaxID=47236 RepID=A0AAV9VSD4_9PEZI